MESKKEIFKFLIKEFHEKKLPEVVKRDLDLPLNSDKIITLSGPRRVGKTYYFYYLIQQLKKKVPLQRILYINFEDDRLFPLKLENLNDLLEAYFELYPENKDKKIYCFFDEIQIVEKWEVFIRRIYDKENVRIFITGSSSKLLAREIASSLRGRTLHYRLYPLSFREFLRFKGIQPEPSVVYGKERFKLKKLFGEYLIFGGFPEVVKEKKDLKPAILNNYYEMIVYRDLVERFALRNTRALRALCKYLVSNIGGLFSINSYYKSAERDLKPARETLFEYISCLQEIEFVYFLPIFSFSLKTQQSNPRKIYIIDNGFFNVVAFKFSKNYGHLLENAVFLELKRSENEIYYYKKKKECDFMIRKSGRWQVYQVTQEINEQNKEREIEGILEAMNFLKLKRGIIITKDQEFEIQEKGRRIQIIPAWKWFLQAN